MPVYRGKGMRLTKEPSELMEKLCEPGISPEEASLYTRGLSRIPALHAFDKSHILTQYRAGVLEKQYAAAMLRYFRKLEEEDAVFTARAEAGDYLTIHSGEALLTADLGKDVGSRLHLGRSSGDLCAVSYRYTLRKKLLKIIEATNHFRGVLIDKAERYADTIMPGYTHLQHAQPTTLGHYFSQWVAGVDRDFDRLSEFYDRMNISPAGAAILVGNEFKMDRAYEAKLLGFNGVQVNTIDCIWGRDFHIDAFGVLVPLASHIGRISEDITTFSSAEFRIVELDDSHCGTSSIMPQKKNPYAAEHLKGVVCQLAGQFVSIVGTYKNPYSAPVIEWIRSEDEAWRWYDEFYMDIMLAADVVDKLIIHEALMKQRADYFWSTATDLAGVMVSKHGVTWRDAHQIVAKVVRMAIAEGIEPKRADQALIDRASIEYSGKPLGMSTEEIQQALDATNSVLAHDMQGGPHPDCVRRALVDFRASLAADAAWLEKSLRYQEDCEAYMEAEIDRLLEA